MAVTFQQCNTEDASSWADECLGNFSEDLIVDMLRQENKKGREISPTLLSLIPKLSNSGAAAPFGPESAVADPAANQRESCEDYVDPAYDSSLKKSAGEKQSETTEAKEQLPVQKLLDSLEGPQLCTQIAMLLLSFMKTGCDQEKYNAYGAKLVDIADELLEAGNFSLLKKIMSMIGQQSRGSAANKNRTVAQELIQTWQSPAFTSKAVQTILGSQERIDPQGYNFLLALGPRIVPDLLALLKTRVMFKADIQKNEQIIAALGQIGDTAVILTLVKLAKSGGLFHQEELFHI